MTPVKSLEIALALMCLVVVCLALFAIYVMAVGLTCGC